MITPIRWLTLMGLSCLLTACSAAGGDSSDTAVESFGVAVEISLEQGAALADQQVTKEEYDAAFRRYQSCMQNLGYELIDVRLSYGVWNYSTDQAMEDDPEAQRCLTEEFGQVDGVWQVANQDTSETAAFVRNCLEANGLRVPDTLVERQGVLDEAGIDVSNCPDMAQ